MNRRDLERARKTLRDALNKHEAPHTSLYLARRQALALLAAADEALATTEDAA